MGAVFECPQIYDGLRIDLYIHAPEGANAQTAKKRGGFSKLVVDVEKEWIEDDDSIPEHLRNPDA